MSGSKASSKDILPLVLSVKATGWRMSDNNSDVADEEFKHVRKSVLDRDDKTCRFCGFKASSWQEVHHLNDDHHDNRKENLVTACMFCHMIQHIGLAGKNKEAILVWLPEIEQAKLHHIVRSILVVNHWANNIINDKNQNPEIKQSAQKMAAASKQLESKFRSREKKAQDLFGTSDPMLLGDMLHMMSNDPATSHLYDNRAQRLQGLRLLPLGRRTQDGVDKMPEIVQSWLEKQGPYANLNPRTWLTLVKNYVPE